MLASTVGALLRRPRRPPSTAAGWPRWLGTTRRVPLAEGEDPFEILGVSVDTEEKEIKARFYAKAKVLHPDVAGRDTKAQFARLVRSYEVLMDRSLRAEFLLRRRGRTGVDASGASSPRAGPNGVRRSSPVDEFNASIRRGRRAKAQRGQRYFEEEMEAEAEAAAEWKRRQQQAAESESTTGMTPGADDWDLERALAMLDGGLLGKLQQDFDEALLYAYLGPRVQEGACEESWRRFDEWMDRFLHTYVLIPVATYLQAPSRGRSSARSGGRLTTRRRLAAMAPPRRSRARAFCIPTYCKSPRGSSSWASWRRGPTVVGRLPFPRGRRGSSSSRTSGGRRRR